MRNPLNKRFLRELKSDGAKYLVIFLFMVMLISLVSAFLITDNNFKNAYDEGFETYNIEDGHLTFTSKPSKELIDRIEETSEVKLTELKYFEGKLSENDRNVRVYKDRDSVNLECLMEGDMPREADEIALDRLFCDNNDLNVGDYITISGTKLRISGFVALPDYSCLFENNSEMMFDSFGFGVGVMTPLGYEKFEKTREFENYAWKYLIRSSSEKEENDRAKAFTEALKEVLKIYNEESFMEAYMKGEDLPEAISIEDFVAKYNNKAIVFPGEDMGKDGVLFTVFCYIVVVIIAFVFSVTISNTIMAESTIIGTLRASGYSKTKLIIHYMTLPVIITIIAAVVGNVLGYTVLKDYFVDIYYESYSLATYKDLWNLDTFIKTTVVPIALMFAINLFTLIRKLRLSPLTFLRREAFSKTKKKSIKLSEKISFMNRFRLRILFTNITSYLVLFAGIVLAAMILVFSIMFGPLFEDYSKLVLDERICEYQYILLDEAETKIQGAEINCVTSLDICKEGYLTDEVNVFGVSNNSSYIKAKIPAGKALLSNGMLEKFGLKSGDTVTLKDHFTEEEYSFEVAGGYRYDAALTVFVNIDDFRKSFDKEADYYNGYFSNEELTDLDEKKIATVVTVKDLTKIVDQLNHSAATFIEIFKVFGVAMFLLLMFVMTKQILEKSQVSISMTKILGFRNTEIAGLYLVMTSFVVVVSLLVSIPIVDVCLRGIFGSYIYKVMTGYIPYIVNNGIYVIMVVTGIVCYAVISLILMRKINKIPKSIALKNVE